MPDLFDYIVVGAGSAGCVVANRLSADPSLRVLLLEAGPEPRSPWIKIPGGVSQLLAPGPYTLGYSTEPEAQLDNRRIYWPRGRGLGGSSAINGMVYLRGHPLDFDHWRQLGNPGWGWKEVLPLFKRAECRPGGDPALRGTTGELTVTDPALRLPFSELYLEAAREAGFAYNEDFNSGHQDGVGYVQFSIRNGMRCSAYDAFLAPVRHRRNLTILTGAQVERINIEARRANGVSYLYKGEHRITNAKREVILAGGAINSPQLLMLSGVGPARHLKEVGIDVVHDLPGIGQNLHDHVYGSLVYKAPQRYSINSRLRGLRAILEGARYILTRSGVLALGTSQNCLFARISDRDQPDVQITTRPFSFVVKSNTIVVAETPTVTTSVCHLRPLSRGSVTLRTQSIADAPLMRANYLENPKDRETMMAGLRLAARIMKARCLEGFEPVSPLPADDDALLERMRSFVGAMFHPVGTCRMGTDHDAVVDAELRVHGIEGLRVADASIMPVVVSGNTNAAVMMIGEKAADLILGRQPPSPDRALGSAQPYSTGQDRVEAVGQT